MSSSQITKLQKAAASASEENSGENVESVIEAPITLADKLPKLIDLLPEQLQPYWQQIQQVPYLEAVLVMLAFYGLAFFIRRFVLNAIVRLAGRTEGELDDRVIAELRGPIFSTVVWLGVMVALAVAGFETGWTVYVTALIFSLIVLIWLRAALAVTSIIINALARDPDRFKKIDVRTEPILVILSKIVILLIGSYVLLIIWGINPVGLLASAGIVGIAVGFAAKDTLANLFSGVFILADRPYRLGDYVNLDSGERGKVTHIGIRSTRILTRDDIEVTIPNGVIGNAKVVNESGGAETKMRIRIDVQCAYDADLDQVVDVLMKIAEAEEDVCDFPSPRVRVRGFADSGINVQLMGWINHPEDRGRIMHVLFMRVHQGFRDAGLEIPYPKRDVTFLNSPS